MSTRRILEGLAELQARVVGTREALSTVVKQLQGGVPAYQASAFNTRTLRNDFVGLLEAETDEALVELREAIKERYGDPIHRAERMRPGKVFAQIYQLETLLERDFRDGVLGNKSPSRLRDLIATFERAYAQFLGERTSASVVELWESAEDLIEALKLTEDLLDAVSNTLSPEFDMPESSSALELYLDGPIELGDVHAKLIALESLYDRFANLLEVSIPESPLQIERIEVGSLWVKVFGDTRVISLVSSLLQSAAAFLYRQYTNEGKIAALPKKLEAVDGLLELTKRLEAAGVDTSGALETLEVTAVGLSKELNTLLLGEPSVEVDGASFSVDDTLRERLIAERGQLLISGGAPDAGVPDSDLPDADGGP